MINRSDSVWEILGSDVQTESQKIISCALSIDHDCGGRCGDVLAKHEAANKKSRQKNAISDLSSPPNKSLYCIIVPV
jgi:hypothetical protein